MDKWAKLMEPITEEDWQKVKTELGCDSCKDGWGTKKCYTCVLMWAMKKIMVDDI